MPGQSDRLLWEKAQLYLNGGTRMVWLIYAERQLIEVLTPHERHLLTTQKTTAGEAYLQGGEVLPGFSVPLREVFPPEGLFG